jgi:hypothetical protein
MTAWLLRSCARRTLQRPSQDVIGRIGSYPINRLAELLLQHATTGDAQRRCLSRPPSVNDGAIMDRHLRACVSLVTGLRTPTIAAL